MEVLKSLGFAHPAHRKFCRLASVYISAKKLPLCVLNPQTSLSSYDRLVEMDICSTGMEWGKKANCEADARKSGFLEVAPCLDF